jgi:uncharacterized Zn finger protein (UPF0148 family)
MAMTVVCPSCARKLNVPDNLMGELVKCPICGQNFKVETEPAAAVPEVPEVQPLQPQTSPPPKREPIEPKEKDEDPATWDFAPRRRRDLEPHRGTLILVLGILSICISCVGLILGPIAWVMGAADLKAIRAGRMDPTGEGTTKAGYVCGIVGTCLQLVGLLACCGINGLQAFLR